MPSLRVWKSVCKRGSVWWYGSLLYITFAEIEGGADGSD